MAHEASVSLEMTILDAYVIGSVCCGGCCRAILQKIHGKVYAEGDSVIAWHHPDNPMRNGTVCTSDLLAGQRSRGIWQQWADATE